MMSRSGALPAVALGTPLCYYFAASLQGDMPEGTKAAGPPAAKPAASRYNRRSIPQGIIDLTSVPAFRPVKNDRGRDGRWVIRYHLFDDADAAAFARGNMLACPSRESGMLARSARPF